MFEPSICNKLRHLVHLEILANFQGEHNKHWQDNPTDAQQMCLWDPWHWWQYQESRLWRRGRCSWPRYFTGHMIVKNPEKHTFFGGRWIISLSFFLSIFTKWLSRTQNIWQSPGWTRSNSPCSYWRPRDTWILNLGKTVWMSWWTNSCNNWYNDYPYIRLHTYENSKSLNKQLQNAANILLQNM